MLINFNPPRLIIGQGCKLFRKRVLNMNLFEFSKKTKINVSTISAFENGNSSNINHLFIYLHACKTKEEQEMFLNMLNEKIKERLETENILFNHQAIKQ